MMKKRRHAQKGYYGSGDKRPALSDQPTSYVSDELLDEGVVSGVSPRLSAEASARLKKKRRKRTAVKIAVAVVACMVIGVGAALAYITNLAGNMHNGIDNNLLARLVDTNGETDPFYMLLMGVDGSAARDASGQYGGAYRSDSIILARIDPGNKKATLVSIPRDTLVEIDGYGEDKINAAHAYGGPSLAVDTVSKFAGVPISHYAEINFDGFKEIVDALGGIEVNVPIEINDDKAGGHLKKGKQTLNGKQALILCRSRHAYDDVGNGDGDGYRAANQRLVLSAIAKKLLSCDVVTMANTVQTMSKYVTTDFEVDKIISLAQHMQGFDPAKDLYTGSTPTTSEYINGGWYEITDNAAWKAMMDRVDQGLPPTEKDEIDEATGTVLSSTGGNSSKSSGSSEKKATKTGTVSIKNGNGKDGVCATAAADIQRLGYTVDTGNADTFDYPDTIVVYDDAKKAADADEIVKAMGKGSAMKNDGTYSFQTDFLVVLGSDWS